MIGRSAEWQMARSAFGSQPEVMTTDGSLRAGPPRTDARRAPRDVRWVRPFLGLAMVAYAAAGTAWFLGGAWYPFADGEGLAAHGDSVLADVSQRTGSVAVISVAILGLVTLGITSLPRPGRIATVAAIAASSIEFGLFALVVPDGRVLVAVAHVPILVIGLPFGWPGGGVTIGSQLPWPVVHQVILLGVGGAWLVLARDLVRRARGGCVHCGRATRETWTRPDRARAWGRWMVGAAVAVPVFYATTRLAWFVGVPLGVPRSFLEEEAASDPTIFAAGAFIALLALGGAGLTLGLVQSWGERVPDWVPILGGRVVPPRAAIVPASAIALLLFSSGIGGLRVWLLGLHPVDSGWATTSPGVLLPFWGLALAGATLAYHLRRRERCSGCGR